MNISTIMIKRSFRWSTLVLLALLLQLLGITIVIDAARAGAALSTSNHGQWLHHDDDHTNHRHRGLQTESSLSTSSNPKGKETQLTNAEKECALFQQAVQSENIQALQYTALTDYCPCLTDTINVDINDGGHVEEVSVCELSNPPAVYEAYCLQEFESVREAVERQQMAFVIALEEHAALLDELLSNNNVDNLLPETITQLIHESQVRLTTALAVSMASAPCLEGCHQFVKLVCCAPKNQSTP